MEILGLSIDDGVFFSTVISLTTFITGYLINGWSNRVKENKRLKDIESLVFSFIEDYKTQIPQQSTDLRLFAKQIMEDSDSTLVTNYSIETKLILEYREDLYKILFKRKFGKSKTKREIFKNIRHNVNQIDACLGYIDSVVLEFKSVNSKYEEEMDTAGTKFYQLLNKVKFDTEIGPVEKKILCKLP